MKFEYKRSPVTEVKKGIYHMLQMGNNHLARNSYYLLQFLLFCTRFKLAHNYLTQWGHFSIPVHILCVFHKVIAAL